MHMFLKRIKISSFSMIFFLHVYVYDFLFWLIQTDYYIVLYSELHVILHSL